MSDTEKLYNAALAEKLSRIGLPKWPQMRVSGPPVTPEQASEIIRRTDTFISHGYDGNDRAWNRHARLLMGIPQEKKIDFPRDDATEEERAAFRDSWNNYYADLQKWQEDWGVISTGYVHNSWISCCFVGGPHGWCSPSGDIYFRDNVGKWPSPEELVKDWAVLAQEFPFLDLEAVFMSGESCEDYIRPVFGLLVREGRVEVFLPDERKFGEEAYHWSSRGPSIEQMAERIALMPARRREVGVSEEMLASWAVVHRQKMILKEEADG